MKTKLFTILVGFLGCLPIFAQNFTLPKLPYSYDAFPNSIDAATMEIHHSKHHQAYVNNLNAALKESPLNSLSLTELQLRASYVDAGIRNNAGGHYNHSLFWEILSPKASTLSGNLESEINKTFTSLDSLKKLLNAEAAKRFGSGWAWLIVTPEKKLAVVSTGNQDNPLMANCSQRGIPILGIDVWEHAYYLKYQNNRGDYLKAIWQIINWEEVAKKYNEALNSPLLNRLDNKSLLDTKYQLTKAGKELFHSENSLTSTQFKVQANSFNSVVESAMEKDTFMNTKYGKELMQEATKLNLYTFKNKSEKKVRQQLNNLHKTYHLFIEQVKI